MTFETGTTLATLGRLVQENMASCFNFCGLFTSRSKVRYNEVPTGEVQDDDEVNVEDVEELGCSLTNGWSLIDTAHFDPWHHVKVKVTPENVHDICAFAVKTGHRVRVLEVTVEGIKGRHAAKMAEFWRAFPNAVLTSLDVESQCSCGLVHTFLTNLLERQHRKHPGLHMNVCVRDVRLATPVQTSVGVTSKDAIKCLSDADYFFHNFGVLE